MLWPFIIVSLVFDPPVTPSENGLGESIASAAQLYRHETLPMGQKRRAPNAAPNPGAAPRAKIGLARFLPRHLQCVQRPVGSHGHAVRIGRR